MLPSQPCNSVLPSPSGQVFAAPGCQKPPPALDPDARVLVISTTAVTPDGGFIRALTTSRLMGVILNAETVKES
jgi:hypothetical protein